MSYPNSTNTASASSDQGSENQADAIEFENESTQLQCTIYDLRLQLEKSLKENSEIKHQFAAQKTQLQIACEANSKLEQETKKKLDLVNEQQREIDYLTQTFRKNCTRHQNLEIDVKKLMRDFNDSERENLRLKRKLSDGEGNEQFRNDKVLKLEKDLKSERETVDIQNSEIFNLQKSLQNLVFELDTLKNTISNNNNKIQKCNTQIEVLAQENKDNQEKITFLENQLQNAEGQHESQQQSIQRLETKARELEPVLAENKRLRQNYEEYSRLVERQETRLKEQDKVTRELGIVKNANFQLEQLFRSKDEEIGIFLGEREKFVVFVEQIKIASEYDEISNNSVADQLNILSDHVQKRFFTIKGVYEYLKKTVSEISPSSTSTSKSSLFPPKASGNASSSATPIISPLSVDWHPLPPTVTPSNSSDCVPSCSQLPSPNSIPSASTSSHPPNSSAGGDQLYNELMSDAVLSLPPMLSPPLPSTSKQALQRNSKLRQVSKTPFKKRAHPKHVSGIIKPRNFKCQACPARFHYFGHLKRHLRDVHRLPLALDNHLGGCRSCGHLFEQRCQRRQHICPTKSIPVLTNEGSNNVVPMATEPPPPSPPIDISSEIHRDAQILIKEESNDDETPMVTQTPPPPSPPPTRLQREETDDDIDIESLDFMDNEVPSGSEMQWSPDDFIESD